TTPRANRPVRERRKRPTGPSDIRPRSKTRLNQTRGQAHRGTCPSATAAKPRREVDSPFPLGTAADQSLGTGSQAGSSFGPDSVSAVGVSDGPAAPVPVHDWASGFQVKADGCQVDDSGTQLSSFARPSAATGWDASCCLSAWKSIFGACTSLAADAPA